MFVPKTPDRLPVRACHRPPAIIGSTPVRGLTLLASLLFLTALPAFAGKPLPPAAPSSLTATAVSSSQINLSWQDNSGNEYGFYIWRGPTTSGPWSLIATVGASVMTYANTGLAAGTTYYYQVCAYNSRGSSGYAGPATATTFPLASDTTAPTVSLSSPANGSTVSGTITLSATASDNVGVVRVDFYRDGTVLLGSDTVSPYSLGFDTTTVANGSHTFVAKAYDAAGNVGTSATVTLTVSNTTPDTTPPTVSLTSPTGGTTVSGTITLSATATDNVGVARVDFYRDGTVLVGSDTASPYSLQFNTATVANGSHSFVAMAYDAAGNAGTSATVTITVSNTTPDTTPPTVSLTAPTGGSTVSGTITLSATATDNVGVARVDFYRDSTVLVGSVTVSPYNLLFDTTTVASGSHSFLAMAYDAAGNVGTSATVTVLVNNCTYSISPASASFTAAGGSGSATVTSSAGCGWVTTSGATWITVVSGGSGTGSGTVSYSVAQNTTTPRSGTLTIAGQTFTVAQAAAADTTPPSVSLTAPTAGNTVSGTVALSATASDNVGVSKVEFYCDTTTLVGTALSAPYSVSENTTTLADGSHSFCAKAYDAAGNSTTSASVTVTVSNATSSPGQLQWLRTSAAQYQARVNGVATDHSGNVIAVGQFVNYVDFGSGLITSAGGWDVFIAKYAPNGSLLWVRAVGGSYSDNAQAVTVDGQNNILVAGTFQGTVDFGGGAVTAYGGSLDSDAFVAKYSPTGGYLWARNFGSSAADTGYGVAVDGNGDVFATSRSGGTVNFGNGISLTGHGGYDIALAKFSGATGATMWAKLYGGSYTDCPNGLAVDRLGDAIVSGSVSSATDVDLGLGPTTAAGVFVAKYSGTDGSCRWVKILGGSAGSTGSAVTADPTTGNVFAAGAIVGTMNFGGGNVSSTGTGAFLAGYDTSGNYLWAKTFMGADSSSVDSAAAVAVDGSGNVALTGQVLGSMNVDGNWFFGSSPTLYIAVFSYSGNTAPVYRWCRSAGGGGESHGQGAAFDSLGHILAGGYFYLTTDFGGISATALNGNYNAFVAQYTK